ncbi:FAD-dependent oxidoreductase [bacterium]|nr:FAD-dependent oxidoreductase [bacterium]
MVGAHSSNLENQKTPSDIDSIINESFIKTGSALVIGGGIAGIQSSLDLANSGFKVYLLESSPAIGGTMAQLDKTFPTNDCAMCILAPKLVECGRHPNIELITNADIEALEGSPGNFGVKILKHPRFVDLDKCTGCGECAKVCPVTVPSEFDELIGERRAIYKPFPQAFPNAYIIDKKERPPCQIACPAGVHAQGYIALLKMKKYKEAYDLIRQNNPFPSVCGRVCNAPCEKSCRRGDYDYPVAIKELKRFISDYVMEHQQDFEEETVPEIIHKDQKIGIIGSGPSGLTAAYFLAKQGYPVTVFEQFSVAGGMLAVGIPNYRLPKEILDFEIEQIKKAGVDIRLNYRVDSIESIKRQGFKALYIASGAHRGVVPTIPNSDSIGVLDAIEFLRLVNLGREIDLGERVAIVGGGNTAIDAARTARRLGAKEVTLIYRRSRTEMPADEREIESALEEGIKAIFLANPSEIDCVDGRLNCVKCLRMELGKPDSSGRRRPVPVEGSDFTVEQNALLYAITQKPEIAFLMGHNNIKISKWGTIKVDPVTLETDEPGIFAGGDVVSGPAYVIDAIAGGRRAAESISRFLQGKDLKEGRKKRTEELNEILPQKNFPEFVEEKPRPVIPTIPVKTRLKNFEEVDLTISEQAALEEAGRCLECGLCSECMECERVCEAHAIQHNQTEEELEIQVGAVILSPGIDTFNPSSKYELGYSRFLNVVTSIQFERILAPSGPFGGHLKRPSDGKLCRRIAWIQCVGSRDNDVKSGYCSSVCCMYAIKEAIISKEHVKEVQPTIFYMDLRAHGKDFDKYFEKAQNEHGVKFIRSRVGRVEEVPESGDLIVHYATEDGKQGSQEFDLVVLSVGFKPSPQVAQLSDKLGIRLNRHGFFRTTNLAPLQTTRPGVFVCGPAAGPKDIPDTVMQASAASASVAELLPEVRGTQVVEKQYPPQKDVTGLTPRIGVFVCRCGINIGGIVDVPAVVEYARELKNVVLVEENMFTCAQDTIERIKEVIEEYDLNRVVVASCSPRTHESLFQETLREAGLNPYLFEMANIRDQCSWVHMNEPEKATAKAKKLVRMAVGKVRLLEALPKIKLPVTQKALVIGGGLAGMTSALSIAEQGYPVFLIEKSPQLGGHLNHLYHTIDGEDIQDFKNHIIEKLQNHPRIKIFKNGRIEKIDGYIGNYRTLIKTDNNENGEELEHGVVVIATGAEAEKPTQYLYGQDPRVIDQLELEKRIFETEQNLSIKGKKPRMELLRMNTLVMIQCVGSRDKEHPYCSRICCQQAVKNAIRLKGMNPEMDIYILYRDMRTYGFTEQYYQEARDKGVIFIRYDEDKKPQAFITESGNNGNTHKVLNIKVLDRLLDYELVINPDLLVLAPPIVPRSDASEVSQMLKVPLNEDNFFLEAHVKLRPVDFATEGVFVAGLAHTPKSMEETISQSKAAAARACTIISRDVFEAEAIISEVNESICAGCGVCEGLCPYGAPLIQEKEGKRVCVVNEALCKGCGVCVSACPSGAMQQKGFRTDQIFAMIGETLQ